jgi:hypothetical protein
MRITIFLSVVLLLASSPLLAQTSYPMLMSLEPVAATAGTTSEHKIRSRYSMLGAHRVLVSGEGVTGEIVQPEMTDEEKEKKPSLTDIKVLFTVQPWAQPGVRDFRIATPAGASTIGQLVIVRDAVVRESADNDTQAQALEIPTPITICGAIEKAEDVDYFKFTARQGQGLSFHVRCMRLQDRIHDLQQHADPLITIRTAAGSTIAAADNYYAADPYLTHVFKEDGEYLLEVRDVRYQGNTYWQYSIEISDRPQVTNVYPLAVNPGLPTPLEMIGFQLPAQQATFYKMPWEIGLGRQWVSLEIAAELTNPVPVVITKQPLVDESLADNNRHEDAQQVTLPGGINGRIEQESDLDHYAFEAKKDEVWTIRVIARRHQSMLDSNLRILNAEGKQLVASDDFGVGKRNYADSCVENWKVPADGKYTIEIRDVHLRGGPEFVYFIESTRAQPYFELQADTDKTQLSPGTAGVVFVRVVRKNGFEGEVLLNTADLGEGVTAASGKILPGRNDGCIIFQAAGDAPMGISNVKIFGTATVRQGDVEQPMTVEAGYYQETYMPGGGRNHFPVEAHSVNVGEPSDLLSVKLGVSSVTLKPGETAQVDVEIQRAEGFKANVTLDMLFRHLGSVYGDSLPEGVEIDANASKTLLTGDTSKGHIVIKATDKAKPVENQQISVMANVSLNFVMKATYSSAPLLVTIAPAEEPAEAEEEAEDEADKQ